MSEVVHFRGKLQEVIAKDNESMQDVAKRILDEALVEKKDYHEDYIECLLDTSYKNVKGYYSEYVLINERLYKVIDCESIDPDDDIIKAEVNPDKTISFEVKYYNGGCGFDEAVEEAVNKIDKKEFVVKMKDGTEKKVLAPNELGAKLVALYGEDKMKEILNIEQRSKG